MAINECESVSFVERLSSLIIFPVFVSSLIVLPVVATFIESGLSTIASSSVARSTSVSTVVVIEMGFASLSSSIIEASSVSTIIVIEVWLVALVSSFFVASEGLSSLLSLISTKGLSLVSLRLIVVLGFALGLSFRSLLFLILIILVILSIIFLEVIIKVLIFLIIENLILINLILIIFIFLGLNLGGSGSWLSRLLGGFSGLLGRLLYR